MMFMFLSGYQRGAHGLSPLGIGVVARLQYVGKQEQFEHGQNNHRFYYDECPKFSSHCHGTESVGVKPEYTGGYMQ